MATGGWRVIAGDWKLIGESLQPFIIIVGGLFALVTYIDTRYREIRRPYDEKQLEVYLESAQVAARLAALPANDDSTEHQNLVTRFWELYWGSLAFVESQSEETSPPSASVEAHMVNLCEQFVSPKEPGFCHGKGNPALKAAIDLAHVESGEIRARWRNSMPLLPAR